MSKLSAGRPSRLKNSHHYSRNSNSPLINHASRSLWARSYQDQPIPTQIRRRLMGKKYQFNESDEQDQKDQQAMAVLEEEEQQQFQQKAKISKLKVIRDWDQFSENRRGRINSQPNISFTQQRCRSVAQFKLPQVLQQKKQQQEPKKKPFSRLSQVKDENQFNQIAHRISSDGSSVRSRAQSMQAPKLKLMGIPQQQIENDIDQTRSTRSQLLRLPNHKFRLSQSLSKLIVDEIDMKQRQKQKHQQQQMRVIQQQKQQQQIDTGKLADLIYKFSQDNKRLDQIKDDQQNISNQQQNIGGQMIPE